MFARILYLDYILFQRINRDWTNVVLDWLMPVLTDLHRNQIFMYGILPLVLGRWFWMERMRAIRAFIGLVIAIGVSDVVCYRGIKPIFERNRPEQVGLSPVLRSESHSGYSFPSNHSSNAFSAASYLTLYYPGYTFQYLFFAAVIAYSRVYVGVHFPSDVVGGAIIGLLIGALVRYLWKFVEFRAIAEERTSALTSEEERRKRWNL